MRLCMYVWICVCTCMRLCLTKLMLAVAWQLMRADVLQFLESLGFDEKDILKWANRKAIEARRPELQIYSSLLTYLNT